MQKQLETILKSANLRKQMEEVVKETIESPLMQSKWQELIKKSGEGSSSADGGEKKETSGESGGSSENDQKNKQ